MEVLIAHPVDPYIEKEGGSVRYVVELTKVLLNHKIKTTLLGVKLHEEKFRDLRSTDKSFDNENFIFIPNYQGSDEWYKFLFKLLISVPFMKIPESTIIHTMRLDFTFPFALFCKNNPKVMVSDEPLNYAKDSYGIFFRVIKYFYHKMEAFSLKRVNVIITDSATEKYFLSKYPWLKKKIVVTSTSGVDTDNFSLLDKEKLRKKYGFDIKDKIILFVGRLEKIKNLDFLLRVFKNLKNDIPNSKLIIVGEGGQRHRLESFAKDLELQDVIFMGEFPNSKIPEIYNLADVLALCSIVEGSPTVVREALACGVPVVSTEVGDVKDIISNQAGKVVNSDEKDFKNALIDVMNLLEDDENGVRSYCRRIALKYSINYIMEDVISVYKNIKI